jgi:hypothetical protein
VNGDTLASEADVLAFIQCCLLGNCNPALGIYSCDIDQSGRVTPADMLREIDVLTGAEQLDAWLNRQRPENTTCPSGR